MFQINGKPCKVDNYCVTKKWDGYNTLEFDVSQNDPLFPLCAEYTDVVERQKYYISKVDGSRTVHVQCSLDLRDFEGIAVDNYDNTSATLATTMAAALPSGWSFVNAAGSTVYRTVTVQYGTALDIIDSCRTLYGVGFVFDTVAKTVTAVNPGGYTQGPAFITEQLNLRRLQYYGDGSGIITRLKARGKDGLTFSDINGGKDYVENYGYSSKVVYGWFVDDRYTSKENLLAAATTKLAELSKPMRSYECDVVDLKAINPAKYTAQDLDIYKIIALKDMSRKTEHTYQVVERREYPHYPEKNVVTLATKAPDLTRRFQELESEISELGLQDDNGWITGDDGGYLYMVRNASGQPTALVFMNALTQAQSTKAGRIDQSGIKYGPTGAMGSFVQMFDIASCVWKSANYAEDGSGNCTAGTMINLSTGEVKSANLKIDASGNLEITGKVTAASGEIGGFTISASGLSGDTCGLYSGAYGGRLELGNVTITGGAAFELSTGADIDGIVDAQAFHAQEEVTCGDFDATGNMYNDLPDSYGGTTVYWGEASRRFVYHPSARKYKNTIRPIKDSDAKKLLDLRPVTFFYNSNDKDMPQALQYGLVADEAAKHFPQMIGYKDGEINSFHYDQLFAPIIKLLQIQAQQIKNLEAKLCSK